jgi:hypothetical protein
MINLIEGGHIPNCPVTKFDVEAAEDIFGPDVGILKGKTVRRKPSQVRALLTQTPSDILTKYKEVTIACDLMYVNGVSFFVTISRHIMFGTVAATPNKSAPQLLNIIRRVKQVYKTRAFSVVQMLVDNEFEPLRGGVAELGIALNTVGADEHVPEVERFIRTIKERTRCYHHSLPFRRVPKRLLIEMVYTAVFWLNTFPHESGISNKYGPRTIITGSQIDFNTHCRLEFGTYVQVHDQHDNSLQARTTGALAIRPSGNSQGGYLFTGYLRVGYYIVINGLNCPCPKKSSPTLKHYVIKKMLSRDLCLAIVIKCRSMNPIP